MTVSSHIISPFLHPGPTSTANSLAVLHLRRDHLIPTTLRSDPAPDTGYAEGHVANTRFGSYPHSTLIGVPWGSQVLASHVDTGSRGRPLKNTKKRKLEELEDDGDGETEEGQREGNGKKQKTAVTAASGFCHLLPPTPEAWTVSLPHRTQVVYTPDYSFIIQKMGVRPGSVVIEAGAGSGSFTHAAARVVFDGYADDKREQPVDGEAKQEVEGQDSVLRVKRQQPTGHVYSFEYHEPRAQELQSEIRLHGLDDLVTVTHRDVYHDGFSLIIPPIPTLDKQTTISQNPQTSPNATHIFLDLPAPWLALPHLVRRPPSAHSSPLDPTTSTHLCCFLPCIEQATRTISALRHLGYLSISMSELAHRRIDVRRERTGLDLEGLRGVNAVASSVEESCRWLEAVERRGREFRDLSGEDAEMMMDEDSDGGGRGKERGGKARRGDRESKVQRLARIAREEETRKGFREGRLVTRTEGEMKCHTSYLIFAVLPREWGEEEERRARERWHVSERDDGGKAQEKSAAGKKGGKQEKKKAKADGRSAESQMDGGREVDGAVEIETLE